MSIWYSTSYSLIFCMFDRFLNKKFFKKLFPLRFTFTCQCLLDCSKLPVTTLNSIYPNSTIIFQCSVPLCTFSEDCFPLYLHLASPFPRGLFLCIISINNTSVMYTIVIYYYTVVITKSCFYFHPDSLLSNDLMYPLSLN